MDGASDLVTIYRSGDSNAEDDAAGVHKELEDAGLHPVTVDDSAAGVVDGSWEVRVPAAEARAAESVIAGLNQEDPHETGADPSHRLDLVTVAATDGTTSEMEALAIRGVLEASGLEPVVVGATSLPSLGFEIRVPAAQAARARQAIAEAEAAGPEAALEAEQETETRGS